MDDVSAIADLPDDSTLLKKLLLERDVQMAEREARIADLQRQREDLRRERDELELAKLRLEVELLRFKKWYYGPKADDLKHYTDSAQLLLQFAGELEARPVNPEDIATAEGSGRVEAETTEASPSAVRRVRRGRRNLAAFDHLPVTRKVHDFPDDQKPCPCCGEMRQRIGQESSCEL
ncbi:MAG TPA: hypothetical protein VHZ24_12810 [Pirellulales bacterium]|jgi:hypothetical protein|nr:hypothetical protein [Pirellulales bacterium]